MKWCCLHELHKGMLMILNGNGRSDVLQPPNLPEMECSRCQCTKLVMKRQSTRATHTVLASNGSLLNAPALTSYLHSIKLVYIHYFVLWYMFNVSQLSTTRDVRCREFSDDEQWMRQPCFTARWAVCRRPGLGDESEWGRTRLDALSGSYRFLYAVLVSFINCNINMLGYLLYYHIYSDDWGCNSQW